MENGTKYFGAFRVARLLAATGFRIRTSAGSGSVGAVRSARTRTSVLVWQCLFLLKLEPCSLHGAELVSAPFSYLDFTCILIRGCKIGLLCFAWPITICQT